MASLKFAIDGVIDTCMSTLGYTLNLNIAAFSVAFIINYAAKMAR